MPTVEEVEEARAYIKEHMGFIPRLSEVMVQGDPHLAKQFTDFYTAVWGEGALSTKHKELIFVAIGVAYRSPACLIHFVPAIERGATDAEILEAVTIGTLAAGFVPGGPGIPYAFQYALKVLETAQKYRAGEPWEYVQPHEFKM